MRTHAKLLFCTFAILVFVAYVQPLNPAVFSPNRLENDLSPFFAATYLAVWAAPAIPMLVCCLVLMGVHQIPPLVAKLLAVFSLATGLLVTLASGVVSLFSDTQMVHAITLTIAVASGFAIWSSREEQAHPPRLAMLGISVATIAALWSLLTVPMISLQSRVIADGSPYCIAHHAPNSPIETLQELRGFSFYTQATGYKSTSEWYFHGLLIVDHPEKQKIYNWSPRRWRFDPVERPDALIKPVRKVCVPS